MGNREDIVKGFYARYKEENRLDGSIQGRVEYLTTMHYIHKFLGEGEKVAEIGAGTGRISIALAKEGYDVTSVEYSDSNFEKLKVNAEGIDNISVFHGDAVNLNMLPDNEYDVTLLFGPMYHLYDKADQMEALHEAKRITKAGGKVLIAFLPVHAIMYTNYIWNREADFDAGFKENFGDDLEVKHFPEQLFTGFNIDEFEKLVEESGLKRITTVSADGMLELACQTEKFGLNDDNLELFMKYHLAYCETRELLGCASHLILVAEN
ncbi:MAG: class I SAM-dependent methyltransferase [Butyrivibrio sp.]|nr:class I SAM-dependent methyltransferase [Butyrivibrio sp.]